MLQQRLQSIVSDAREQGIYRFRRLNRPGAVRFDSSDYLSLASNALIREAFCEGFKRYPAGSSGSMLVCGYHPVHQEFEAQFAEFVGAEACLLFTSGYVANLAVMRLLAALQAEVYIDKQCHASIYDGLQATGLSYHRFRHNDASHLSQLIAASDIREPVVVTEGIFSMSGQVAQLQDFPECRLIVDESHALGVWGLQGRGVSFGLPQRPLAVFPLGKGFAAQGAIVAGQRDWVDALTQVARSFIYSTAPSPAYCHGLIKALEVLNAAEAEREHLQALIEHFRKKANQTDWRFSSSITPIQFLHLGCPHKALALAEHLSRHGIVTTPIRAPSVSVKDTGLRLVLNASHQLEDIDNLFDNLRGYYDSSA